MTTAKDIAARLQISASTVGRALADDPRISAATKQRVMEAAAEIGYVASRAARMMRGVSSNLVGLVLPDIRNGFFSTIAHSLSKCLEAGEYQLMLSESDDDRSVELKHLRELSSANVAGVIIVPTARPLAESARLLAQTPHIQLLRRHPSLGEQWFGIDDTRALELATEHLLELGHERIAYIGSSAELTTGASRVRGFRNAIRGTAAAEQANEVLDRPSAMDAARDGLRRLLALPKPPTAIVMGSVQMTLGVLEELIHLGVRVPDELSLVGFGDELGFRWWGPGLTTLTLPVSELATACGLWFLHQLKQKTPSTTPYSSITPAVLVVRGSTRRIGPPTVRPVVAALDAAEQ